MTKRVRKIATYCMIGTLTFAGQSIVSSAAEVPVAGIDMVLNEFYSNTPDTNIIDLLSPTESEYKDIAISNVVNYVNIRNKPNEESKLVGKLYSNSAVTILEKEGDWFKIKSGSVTGYIRSDYLITGEKVEELAKTIGNRIATVNTTTLKVREKNSMDAVVVTLIPIGEELEVVKELDGWVKVSLDADVVGFVSADYVDLRTEFKEAESIEEEKARLAKEAARLEAEEAARQAAASSNVTHSSSSSVRKRPSYSSSSSDSSNSSSDNTGNAPSATSSNRQEIVNYALRFIGNPYVWGGTSLTNGADCSGFTQSILRNFGIYIPRVSRDQANGGREVSLSNAQAGDLIFYTSGGVVNHVAMYIGNGQVVHASSPKTGIKISNYTYRQPYKVVSYIN